VKLRLAFCIAIFAAAVAPAMAQDSAHGLAPADEYFGRFNLSVLGIANTIRDAGARMDSGTEPRSMLSGPLSFVTDAVKDWEQKYPSDPWIAKDLLALETVYLRVPGDDGYRLAAQTESWLLADYPKTNEAAKGRVQLASYRSGGVPPQQQAYQGIPSYASPWERFAALRVPLPPR
jgi:hypothetical protein